MVVYKTCGMLVQLIRNNPDAIFVICPNLENRTLAERIANNGRAAEI